MGSLFIFSGSITTQRSDGFYFPATISGLHLMPFPALRYLPDFPRGNKGASLVRTLQKDLPPVGWRVLNIPNLNLNASTSEMSVTPSGGAFGLWAILVSIKFSSHSLFLIFPLRCACTPVTKQMNLVHTAHLYLFASSFHAASASGVLSSQSNTDTSFICCRGHGFWSL